MPTPADSMCEGKDRVHCEAAQLVQGHMRGFPPRSASGSDRGMRQSHTNLEVQYVAVVHGAAVKRERGATLTITQIIGEVGRRGGVVVLRRVLPRMEEQPLR
jgi:hypothetical protein